MTKKIGLLFPGGDVITPSAIRAAYEGFLKVREVYFRSGDLPKIQQVVFEKSPRFFRDIGFMQKGIIERFSRENYAQSAIFITNHAIYELLVEKLPYLRNLGCLAIAGNNVGEYNALVASGALDYGTALSLVQKLGKPDLLRGEIEAASINLADPPIVANSQTRFIVDEKDIRDELYRQMDSPSSWDKSIVSMFLRGVNYFIIVGPDTEEVVVKKIKKMYDIESFTVRDRLSLDDIVERLEGEFGHKRFGYEGGF